MTNNQNERSKDFDQPTKPKVQHSEQAESDSLAPQTGQA
jgi:hypothetical protein